MSTAASTRIGPYEILSALGAGGMGEVFRAWDYRLEREVAVKVVKSAGYDPDWQQRFLQEARAVGGVNHPNILTVHDVGVEAGMPYLVTELVEGDSLKSVLTRGRLSVKQVLDIGEQIAAGLAAAHRAGIVHRDLKPANIMVTKAGLVKVLDFGLAKQVSALQAGTSKELTEPGMIMGTATYMSPEQARGEPVDIRSDQFSLGLILYEMLSGVPAFDRDTAVGIMAAIVSEECPPIATLNPAIPAPLVWVVDRCLLKDRESRYASTFDLYYDLKVLRDGARKESPQPAPAEPVQVAKSRPIASFVALGTACLLLAALSFRLLSVSQGKVDFERYRFSPLATTGASEEEAAWSPNGKNIAFTADAGSVRQVFVRNLSAYASAQITRGPQDARQPFWSADGSRILYLAAGESGATALWSVGATGGAPTLLRTGVEAASTASDGTLAYLQPDAGEGLALWIAPDAQAAAPQRYAQGDWAKRTFSHGYVAFAPDNKSIGLWLSTGSGLSEFWVLPYPVGNPRRAFTFEDGIYPFHWLPDNRHILFGGVFPGTIGSDLHIADLETGRFLPITKTTQEALQPAVSPDSQHIAFTVADHDFDILQWSEKDPILKPMMASSRNELSPAWSPVGSQMAFVSDRTGTTEIWLRSLSDGWERPLVAAKDLGRAWVSSFRDLSFSADGQRLAFAASRAGSHSIYLFNLAGGPMIKLTAGADEERAPSWSPDGYTLAFAMNTKGSWWLATAGSGGGGKPALLHKFPSIHDVRWSPDGKVIACNMRDELFLVSPDGATIKPLSAARWLTFDWRKNGAELVGIVRRPDGKRALVSVDAATGVTHDIAALDLPSLAEIGRLSIARETGQIAAAVGKPRSEIWMLDGFPTPQNLLARLRAAF
ncbi:MAG TPA: protein kinase [Bryobacteraceae bacterium]|jgi:serine/threonine protein kinase